MSLVSTYSIPPSFSRERKRDEENKDRKRDDKKVLPAQQQLSAPRSEGRSPKVGKVLCVFLMSLELIHDKNRNRRLREMIVRIARDAGPLKSRGKKKKRRECPRLLLKVTSTKTMMSTKKGGPFLLLLL